jgi:hypothetical protein
MDPRMKVFPLSVLCALAAGAAPVRQVKGVQFPEVTRVDGTELRLSGVGVRNRWFIDVYVAALYVADPAGDGLAEQPRQMKIFMLRDVARDQVGEAIREGFERNASRDMPKLRERLERLIDALTDVKKGETLIFTYEPDKGTTVTGPGKVLAQIEGRDFGGALFAVWLGRNPVDESLKRGLLGK